MRYFVNEDERKSSGSTYYFEFLKGEYRNKHWLKDSLCIHGELFEELLLFRLFADTQGKFDYFGPDNVIEKDRWCKIVERSEENEEWKLVIEELTPWAEDCLNKHKCFTICGI